MLKTKTIALTSDLYPAVWYTCYYPCPSCNVFVSNLKYKLLLTCTSEDRLNYLSISGFNLDSFDWVSAGNTQQGENLWQLNLVLSEETGSFPHLRRMSWLLNDTQSAINQHCTNMFFIEHKSEVLSADMIIETAATVCMYVGFINVGLLKPLQLLWDTFPPGRLQLLHYQFVSWAQMSSSGIKTQTQWCLCSPAPVLIHRTRC